MGGMAAWNLGKKLVGVPVSYGAVGLSYPQVTTDKAESTDTSRLDFFPRLPCGLAVPESLVDRAYPRLAASRAESPGVDVTEHLLGLTAWRGQPHSRGFSSNGSQDDSVSKSLQVDCYAVFEQSDESSTLGTHFPKLAWWRGPNPGRGTRKSAGSSWKA